MKEPEFIELLNLYVDHEINAEDAARLEAEVMANPGRRRIYRQYCSMDKACSMLAAKFGETAVMAAPLRTPAPRRDWAAGFYATGLLAAACVAIFLVVRTRSGSSAATVAAADTAVHPAAVLAGAKESSTSLAVYDRPLQPVLTVRDLSLNGDNPAVDALMRVNGQNDPFAWISRTQTGVLPRSLVLPVNFHTGPDILPDASAAPTSPIQPPAVENAAFRFTR